MSDYMILDEPKPSGLTPFALNPMWPLFALMLISSGAAWVWFVFNSMALGSPFRRQEWIWIGAGVVGSFLYVVGVLYVTGAYDLPKGTIPYFLIGLTVLKLVVGYRVYLYQARSFQMLEYFSQTPVKNGALPLAVLWFAAAKLQLGKLLHPVVFLALM